MLVVYIYLFAVTWVFLSPWVDHDDSKIDFYFHPDPWGGDPIWPGFFEPRQTLKIYGIFYLHLPEEISNYFPRILMDFVDHHWESQQLMVYLHNFGPQNHEKWRF